VAVLSREEKLALLKSRLGGNAAAVQADSLTPAQARLWELEQQLGSNAMHVFALAYHLEGPVDVQRLAESIEAVAARHPALHSRIAVANGRPFFEHAAPPSLVLRSVFCERDEAGDEKLANALRAEAETRIDPQAGAGWRAVLLERSAESHALLVQFHHIFADRWSVGVFMTDVATAYRNLGANRPAFDSDLPRTTPIAADVPAAQLAYWTKRFELPAATLELPGAHRMESFSDYVGARIESVLDAESVAAARTLAAAEATTMFPLLLAAFAATLHAHTGQEDLVICTPMVGRHRAGTRGTIGYFNNIVPLRLDLRGDPTFQELVARATAEGREATAYQDVPFHAIASLPELASARITRCLFAVQNMPGLLLDLPDVSVRYRDVPNGTANFDLALFLEEGAEGVDVLLDHKSAVIDDAAAHSIKDRFYQILGLVTSQPDIKLSALPQYPRETAEIVRETGGYRPRNLLEHRMVEVWRTVFPGAEINGGSHFFDLGGDSMRAARLFALIEKEFGHQLPLASLLEAPTPRHLTAKMYDADWVAPWLSLIPIKATGTRPPLFCVHGGGGGVLTFKFIGDCLEEDQPLYTLQARGLKRGEKPLESVEEMAEHYVASVKQLRPEGPYRLAGHSLGAAVAYEMAQRFTAAGDRVDFLGLFDHPGPRIKHGWRDWLAYQMSYISSLPPTDRAGFVWRGISEKSHLPEISRRVSSSFKRLSHKKVKANGPKQDKAAASNPHPAANEPKRAKNMPAPDLFDSSLTAMLAYQVKPYAGGVTLFRAHRGSPRIHSDPLGGWSGVVAGGVHVVEVPGTHNSMLEQPNVRVLGEAISRCIAQLDASA
jgi:thioesterase domain-containing protein/acyl carrier protein